MSKKELKTNAMRLLDRLKIPYEYETYECDEFVSGVQYIRHWLQPVRAESIMFL